MDWGSTRGRAARQPCRTIIRAVKDRAHPCAITHPTVFNHGAFPAAYEDRAFSGGRSMAARTIGMPQNARSTSK